MLFYVKVSSPSAASEQSYRKSIRGFMYFSSDKIEICIYNINASNSFSKWHYGKIKIAEVADPNDVCSGKKNDTIPVLWYHFLRLRTSKEAFLDVLHILQSYLLIYSWCYSEKAGWKERGRLKSQKLKSPVCIWLFNPRLFEERMSKSMITTIILILVLWFMSQVFCLFIFFLTFSFDFDWSRTPQNNSNKKDNTREIKTWTYF